MAQTVGHQKEDIEKRKPNQLGTFDADEFTLYRIDQGNETVLNPLHTLSKVFGPAGHPETEEMTHILVHLLESESINSVLGGCFILLIVARTNTLYT